MKKIIIMFLLLIMTTGCSNNLYIEFTDNSIEFDIESTFNLNEYKNVTTVYNSEFDSNISDTDLHKFIVSQQDNFQIPVFYEDNETKENVNKMLKTNLSNNKKDYTLTAEYIYSYDNFKDNYLFNYCFDYFDFTEDDKSYYFKVSGNYKCSYENVKLNLKAYDRVLNTNSVDIHDNFYSWDIKNENNDIYFAISKEPLDFKGTNIFYILSGIILTIMIIISISIYKKYSN